MKLTVIGPYDYSPKMKVGDVVEIDKIKRQEDSMSKFMVRVVGVWTKPKWFDVAWFLKDKDGSTTKP